MSNIPALQNFLIGLQIVHFRAGEFGILPNATWQGPIQVIPPEAMFPNIAATVMLCDEIRHRLGVGVRVLSSYRPLKYNRHIKSQDTSQHVQFRAMDITTSNYSDLVSIASHVVTDFRKAGFQVGFGRYDNRKFIHIDVGHRDRDWSL
jgi:hypothetical protein